MRFFDEIAASPADRGLWLQGDGEASYRFIAYQQLAIDIQAMASQFAAAGVTTGTRVLIPFRTDAATITSFLALIWIGALPLSIKPSEVGGSTGEYHRWLERLMARFGPSKMATSRGDLDAPSGISVLAIDQLYEAIKKNVSPVSVPRAPFDPDRLVFVQFSSGSTGEPKGVPITAGALTQQLDLIVNHDSRRPGETVAAWLPLYHDMGLVGTFLSCLHVGSTLHLTTPLAFVMAPLKWLRHLATVSAIGTAMPPFGIGIILRALARDGSAALMGADFSACRYIYIGAETVDPAQLAAVSDALASFGMPRGAFKPCYGMAETVLIVTGTASNAEFCSEMREQGQIYAGVGRALPGFEIRVRSEDGAILADGMIGEIGLRGGSLFRGYFEHAQPAVDALGWFATRDMGFMRGGELFITGRIGERIKVNGQMRFATDFERIIGSLPFVRRGRVIVAQSGGHLLALLEPSTVKVPLRATAYAETVASAVAGATGIKLAVENIHFVRCGSLTKTSSGKLRRQAAVEAWREGSLAQATVANVLWDSAVRSSVKSRLWFYSYGRSR